MLVQVGLLGFEDLDGRLDFLVLCLLSGMLRLHIVLRTTHTNKRITKICHIFYSLVKPSGGGRNEC